MEGITKRFMLNVNNKVNQHHQQPGAGKPLKRIVNAFKGKRSAPAPAPSVQSSVDDIYKHVDEPMDIDVDLPEVISATNVFTNKVRDATVPPVDLDIHDSTVKYLMVRERKRAVTPDFLAYTELNSRMRQILIDWLFQVEIRCNMSCNTLQLGVAMLDYCLSNMTMPRHQLQLLGATCMFMAAKFEEVFAPSLTDIVYLAASAFTRKDVVNMEVAVFNCLEFDINLTTPIHFIDPYKLFFRPSDLTCCFADLLIDLSVASYDLCQLLPSLRAQTALYLGYRLAGEKFPKKAFALFGSTEKELQLAALQFRQLLEQFSTTQKDCTLHRKYRHTQYRQFQCRINMEIIKAAYNF